MAAQFSDDRWVAIGWGPCDCDISFPNILGHSAQQIITIDNKAILIDILPTYNSYANFAYMWTFMSFPLK